MPGWENNAGRLKSGEAGTAAWRGQGPLWTLWKALSHTEGSRGRACLRGWPGGSDHHRPGRTVALRLKDMGYLSVL